MKEEDRWGRLVVDYRLLNARTKEEPSTSEDADAMTRWLASTLWRSVADLLWGFNHLVLTRRSAALMQIATSMGILQPTVLGFGVHGGPAAMQKVVNAIFAEFRETGVLRTFIDDTAVGTGKANEVPDPCDPSDPRAEKLFEEHLQVMDAVLKKAASGGLKFKLDKCNFAQLICKVLGFTTGQGVRSLDEDKVTHVLIWPRPTRIGDVDRFVGFTGFLRTHCAATYSKECAPLRPLQKTQLLRKGDVRYWKKLVESAEDIDDLIQDLPPKGYIPEFTWREGKSCNRKKLLRSGTSPWSIECEYSFRELKRLVAAAIDLYTPNFPGARDGTFPFFIFPDACGF